MQCRQMWGKIAEFYWLVLTSLLYQPIGLGYFSPHLTSLHRTNVANWIILSSSMYAAGRILVKLYHETVVGSVYGNLARKMVVGATYEQKVITNWITPKNAHLSSL